MACKNAKHCRKLILAAVAAAIALGACGSTPEPVQPALLPPATVQPALPPPAAGPPQVAVAGDRQWQLVTAAYDFIGADQLFVGGTRYNFDCTGAVLAIYAAAGVNLGRRFADYTGNGVARVYKMVVAHGLYYPAAPRLLPAPGDLVFFDNTFDSNGDGRWNDELTHVAMVTAASGDGTISYVHTHVRRGVVIEQMNLLHPDAVPPNAPMRQRGAPRDGTGRWLASHLVRGFGRAFLLPT